MSDRNPIINPILKTWDGLNAYVMVEEDEEVLQALLDEEMTGRQRIKFVYRIHSRINKLRADRERRELATQIKSKGS